MLQHGLFIPPLKGLSGGTTLDREASDWKQPALILFAFAGPFMCVGAAYSLGNAGLVGGSIIYVVTTLASIGGSLMLLQIRLLFPRCYTAGDLGEEMLGKRGQIWGDLVQLANFVFFLPMALLLCANALAGNVDVESFNRCNNYDTFFMAAVCLLATQMRTLSNTQVLSILSLISVFTTAMLQIISAVTYTVEATAPARASGSPWDHGAASSAEAHTRAPSRDQCADGT